MLEILKDTLFDNLNIFPFLFITYLILEWLETKTSDRVSTLIQKSYRSGPLIGSLLGALPQCGFSVVASNFYAARLITRGTLIAILLSTSDELLPIMISRNVPIKTIVTILSYKLICGIIFGYLIDWSRKKRFKQNAQPQLDIASLCQNEHCHCKHKILRPALWHSVRITIFIFIISLLLNICLSYYFADMQHLSTWLQIPIFGGMISGLIGLIPNCSASVILTQLYLDNYINFSTLMSGSLVSGGVGLLVLFRVNRRLKENIKIVVLLYLLGLLGGLCSNIL